jgi:CPA2 family monovalent cation:H+ antiporter-2
VNSDEEHQLLHDLLDSVDSMDITWLRLPDESDLVGRTLVEADLRNRTGASVVAMTRNGALIANPKSFTVFERGDRIGVIGEPAHLEAVAELVSGSVRANARLDEHGSTFHDRGTPEPDTTS